MKHFLKKKIYFPLSILLFCFLCSCGSKDAETEANAKPGADSSDSATITPSANKEEDRPKTEPASTPASSSTRQPVRYHAMIYDNLSKGTTRELDIAEGDTIDIDEFIQLLGYNFIGCYDSPTQKDEKYIDEDGLVCTEVVSDVVLYAWYEPKNYTLSFTCNDKDGSEYGLQNINVAYDSDICEFLPLNRIVGENQLIYSTSYGELFLTDITSDQKVLLNNATFQGSDIFMENARIVLNLETVTVSMEENFGLQEVCIKDDYDQFEQRFKDEYICDGFPFEDVDFELLEKLGFNTAIINVTCGIREKDDGEQEIYVYNMTYENNKDDGKKEQKNKKKEMEDFLLGQKTHDCEKKDVEETTILTLEVPISRLKTGTGIYVYYGANGFGDDDWYRVHTNINVKFEQRLDK